MLHQVVHTHLEGFLAETAAATDGVGVPRFIERELRDFLGCGALDRGFARVRCDTCRFERLVPFSCKARAVCPSCGGRRMAEQAAHLVDTVLPTVPVRQWVLTVPHRLRYRLAFDHALCRAVLGVFIRTVLGWYRRRGRRVETAATRGTGGVPPQLEDPPSSPAAPRRWRWAELLQRVFAVDVLACPKCGGRMRVIATIEDPRVVRRILTHLGLAGDEGPPADSRPCSAE